MTNSFTTAMNKLSFLESELSPLEDALSLIPHRTQQYKDIDALKNYLAGRGIRHIYTKEDESALAAFVSDITIYSRCRFEFRLKCGLILEEASTARKEQAGKRHGRSISDPRRERRQDGTHSIRVPH